MWSEKVKEARKKAGITQNGMFEKMKIPSRTVQQWEAGNRVPPEYVQELVLEKLERISDGKE